MGIVAEELVSVLLQFLEVAVHTAVYASNLYTKDAFERCRIFSTFTRRSRHPELNSYISSTINRLRVSRSLKTTGCTDKYRGTFRSTEAA
jgi:hypothetical protein